MNRKKKKTEGVRVYVSKKAKIVINKKKRIK